MIELILTALLSVGIVFALREWKRSRLLCIAIVLLTGIGIFFVWRQDASMQVARALGVGRGADLVLYIYAAISFVLIISVVLRIRALQETLTDLARAIALAQPARPDGSVTAGGSGAAGAGDGQREGGP